jgi:hypothetical protein
VVDNQLLRDTGVPGIRPTDQRALEVVAYDLPLYSGMPLCCDATLVSPLTREAAPHHSSHEVPGAALLQAERKKRRTYREIVEGRHAKLLVLGNEVGGRWSDDALTTLKLLAAARARSAPQLLRGQLSAALRARWSAMVAMAVQDATAATLTGAGCGALHFTSGPVPAWGEVGDDV